MVKHHVFQRTMRLLFCLALISSGTANAALITGVSATATSELVLPSPFNRAAMNAVNGSGLVHGATPFDTTHMPHAEGLFWESVGVGWFGDDRDPAITFNLNGLYTLDFMLVWAYGEPDRAIARADLQTSLDGVNFTSIREQSFGNDLNPAQQFDLSGVTARFVRFDILANSMGDQFPYEGTPPLLITGLVGLGEVQFFGVAAVPEPTSVALLGLTAAGGALAAWRRKRRAQTLIGEAVNAE